MKVSALLCALLLTARCSCGWPAPSAAGRTDHSPGHAPDTDEGCQERSAARVIAELERAAAGLLFRSEADHPLRPFVWPGDEPFSLERLLELRNYPPGTPVETFDVAQFFRHAVAAPAEPHDPAAHRSARRFRALVSTLKKNLEAITVYKIGEIEIDVYIIGRTCDGRYVGLSTKVVET